MANTKSSLATTSVIISTILVVFAYANLGNEMSIIAAFVSIAIMLIPTGVYIGYLSKEGLLGATLVSIIGIIAIGSIFTAGAFAAIFLGAIFCTGGLAIPIIIGIGHIIVSIFTVGRSKNDEPKVEQNPIEHYVALARATKMTDSQITDRLLMNGWSQEAIDAVL